MLRIFKWVAPVVALGLMSMFVGQNVRAADEPTSQPSAGAGSIVVTVTDSSSKPVAGVNLSLSMAKAMKPAPTAKKPKGPKELAKGVTDADGKFTFSGLAAGSYRINAMLEGTGHGVGKATLSDENMSATVAITLKAPEAGADAPKAPAEGGAK